MATVLETTPTLFGAYVISISTTLSWGSQGASSQFKLVEDPDNGVVIDIPPIGNPVIFPGTNQTLGSFSYSKPLASGILQRATYSESLSGRTYDVVIVSPATIFSGVQVILNTFNGTGSGGNLVDNIGINNILNVYAHYENFFASPPGSFGGSAVDDLGFALSSINRYGTTVDLFQTIVNMTADPGYSMFGDPIKHGTFSYQLDFSELYNAIASRNLWYYRVKGDVIDLASLISEVCDLMQFDWMIQLEDRGLTYPVLMLKLMDRSQVPVGGVIHDFIEDARAGGNLISSNYGEELATGTTAKVVSGAPVSRYVEQGIGATVPMWGRATGEHWTVHPNMSSTSAIYTVANLTNPDYYFTLHLPNGGGQWNVTLFELRMLTGAKPKESWQLFKTFQSIANKEPNGYNGEDGLARAPWFAKSQVNYDQLKDLADGKRISKQDMQQTNIKESEKRIDKKRAQLLDELFGWVSQVASSFCRDFMVNVPRDAGGNTEQIRWVNTYGDSSIKRYQYAWDVVGDAWHNYPKVNRSDFFNNGRLKSMAGFPDAVSTNTWGSNQAGAIPMDMSPFGESAFKSYGAIYSLGAGPAEEEIYIIQDVSYVPYSVDANPLAVDDWTTPYFAISSLAKYFFDLDISPDLYIAPNTSSFIYEVPPLRILPFMLGVPQQSNKYNYGPWLQVGPGASVAGYAAGKTQVEFDTSLSPETFGGFIGLNQAGAALAQIDIGRVGVSETGMAEIVGPPEYNIGEQFQQGGPYVSDLDVAVGTDGIKHTYKFNTWTTSFGKLAKHNIELLSRIGTSSFGNQSGGSPVTAILKGTYGMSNITARRIAKDLSAETRRSIVNQDDRPGDKDKSDSIEFTVGEKEAPAGGQGGGSTGGQGGGGTPPVTPPANITPPVTPPANITPPVTPGGGGGGGGGTGNYSDRRLKTDIERVGTSPRGIPIYEFRFKDNLDIKYQGTIAQDLLEMGMGDVVGKGENGFYTVDYDNIDVEQFQIRELS